MISKADIHAARAPLAGFVAVGLFWGGFAALVPEIKVNIDADDGEFGLAMFVAALGAIAAMWLAPLADRALGRRAMLVSALALAGAFVLPGMANGVAVFAAAMLLCSGASGTLDVIMNARLSAIEAARARPLMNFAHASFSFSYAVAALGAGFAREAALPAVAVFAALALLTIFLTIWLVQDAAPAIADHMGGTAPANGLLWFAGVIILIAFMTEQATEGWSALHLERNLGAGAAQGATGPAILGLTMGIGRMLGQALVHRWPELWVSAIAAVLCAAGAMVAAFAPNLAIAYGGFAALGFGVSVVAPMMFAYVGRRVDAAQRTRAIARISVIGYSGFFIGPPMMGFLAQAFGLPISFAAIGLCMMTVSIVLVPLLATRRSHNLAH